MYQPCSNTTAERQYDGGSYGKPEPHETDRKLAEARALARVLRVTPANSMVHQDGRHVVADAISEQLELSDCKSIAGLMSAAYQLGGTPDHAEIGRIVCKVIQDFATPIAEKYVGEELAKLASPDDGDY